MIGISGKKFKFHLNMIITDTVLQGQCIFMIIYRSHLIRMRDVLGKFKEKIKQAFCVLNMHF
jgi:hypothetical protein